MISSFLLRTGIVAVLGSRTQYSLSGLPIFQISSWKIKSESTSFLLCHTNTSSFQSFCSAPTSGLLNIDARQNRSCGSSICKDRTSRADTSFIRSQEDVKASQSKYGSLQVWNVQTYSCWIKQVMIWGNKSNENVYFRLWDVTSHLFKDKTAMTLPAIVFQDFSVLVCTHTLLLYVTHTWCVKKMKACFSNYVLVYSALQQHSCSLNAPQLITLQQKNSTDF